MDYYDHYGILVPNTVSGTVLVPNKYLLKCKHINLRVKKKKTFKNYLIQSDSLKESFFREPLKGKATNSPFNSQWALLLKKISCS